jgi:hypothetical protein
LSRAPGPVFAAYAVAAAFGTYFCMYAFRKPFDAVTFAGARFGGTPIDLKTACVIAQVLGYTLSKYLGARFCAEVTAGRRALLLVGLIVVAELGLLLFAVLPPDGKVAAMVLNGLPLGMVWGLVVRYLEGRRSSDLLVAGLSCSFILAGAVTRDVGRDLVMRRWGVAEAWMPFVTGGLFLAPLLATVWLLDRLPPPSAADVVARAPRPTMDGSRRRAFLAHFGPGFALLLVAYFFLTAFRDFRDHYGAELFDSLGLAHQRAIFSRTERWALFGAIAALAGLNLIADHRRALCAVYAVIVAGFALVGAATLAFRHGGLSGADWMAWVGVGLYLAYVPYGAVLFERMMAASRFAGTSVFAIQLADGIGYTGSALIQLYRDLFHGHVDRLAFIIPYAYVVSLAGVVLMTASAALTLRRLRAPTASAGRQGFDADGGGPGSMPEVTGQHPREVTR